MSNAAVEAAGPVVERFAAASGRVLGWLGVGAGGLVGVASLVDDPVHDWAGAGAGLAIGIASWLVLVRPRASLHADGVLLRNILRDSYLPFSAVERCRVTQTLMIYAAGQTYHGLGVSRSARSIMREQRGSTTALGAGPALAGGFGSSRREQAEAEPVHRFANEEQTGGTYAGYVESRILSKANAVDDDGREPVVAWDWPAVAALVVATLGVLSLFL